MTGPLAFESTEPVTSALIRGEDVVKAYAVGTSEIEILHGISLEISGGEMVAVMGPSGSGKSTLLYCLAGLESATAGRISLAGQEVAGLSRAALARLRRSQVGFVFQSYNLVPTLTAVENVELPYLLDRKTPPADLILETLDRVGLGHRRNARPPSMSGGEQQRVAMARVLAQQPRIVFADEPTGALDTRSGELVLDELGELAHQPDRCVCVVTHDPFVAAACDRVLFLRDGLLVEQLQAATAQTVAATLTSLTTEG